MDENFEIGNEEKGTFSVKFGEDGKKPTFIKDGEQVEDSLTWTKEILPLFGYTEEVKEIQEAYGVDNKNKKEILFTGDFGKLKIKENGGLEFERKTQDQNSPKVPA